MNLVAWPIIGRDDISAVTEVVTSGVFVKGPKSEELANSFANFVSAKFCQTVGSCTHALHLALKAVDVGHGDDVLVPNLTYVGTVSPVVNAGANPIFVDVNPDDYNISIEDISKKITSNTKAIIPVHLHGYPCDVDKIRKEYPELIIIEDVCQAHGAKVNNRAVGTIGHIGCFSLNQVKPLCGGQGGLIVTNDRSLFKKIKRLASPGMDETIGLSYEITETSAALAISQLGKLSKLIALAQNNFDSFKNELSPRLRNILPATEENASAVWHKLRLRLGNLDLESVRSLFETNGVPYDTWPYSLVSQRSEYKKRFSNISDTPVAEDILNKTIIIGNEKYPFHIQSTKTVLHWAEIINNNF